MVRQYVGETLHKPQCVQPLTPQQVVSPILPLPAGGRGDTVASTIRSSNPADQSQLSSVDPEQRDSLQVYSYPLQVLILDSVPDASLWKTFINSTPMIWFTEALWCLTSWLSSVKLIQNFLSKRFPPWWVSLRGFLPAVRGHLQAGGDGADHWVELGTAAASNTVDVTSRVLRGLAFKALLDFGG